MTRFIKLDVMLSELFVEDEDEDEALDEPKFCKSSSIRIFFLSP